MRHGSWAGAGKRKGRALWKRKEERGGAAGPPAGQRGKGRDGPISGVGPEWKKINFF